MTGELEAICDELAVVVERLDDYALGLLKEASAAGERDRPLLERRVTRARHALERAIGLLAEPDEDAP